MNALLLGLERKDHRGASELQHSLAWQLRENIELLFLGQRGRQPCKMERKSATHLIRRFSDDMKAH